MQPLPALTAANAGIILIDLQQGPITTITTLDLSTLRANAAKLAQVADLLELPLVLAAGTQPGPGGAVIHELAARPNLIRHSTPNACLTPAFMATVAALHRDHLILGGIALDVGVLLTALGLRAAGHTVYVAADVVGAATDRAEQAAFWRLTQAGVICSSWASLAAEIQQDFDAPHGRELLGLINPRLQP